MNRKALERILVAIGVAAGIITITAAQASAIGGVNHSEPTLDRNGAAS